MRKTDPMTYVVATCDNNGSAAMSCMTLISTGGSIPVDRQELQRA